MSVPMGNQRYERYRQYVAYVQRRCTQPAVRAALRSGLRRTPEQSPRMHALIAVKVPEQASAAEERAYYAVAALIAAQPRAGRDRDRQHVPATTDDTRDGGGGAGPAGGPAATPAQPVYPRSLGYCLAQLNAREHAMERSNTDSAADQRRRGEEDDHGAALTPMERRLHILTRQGLDGLHRHLPAIIYRLRTQRVEVDWAQLLDDLAGWPRYRDKITKRWLQEYYRASAAAVGSSPAGVLDPDSTFDEE